MVQMWIDKVISSTFWKNKYQNNVSERPGVVLADQVIVEGPLPHAEEEPRDEVDRNI